MGKNKLSKFADMATYSHVLQYPFSRLQQEKFPYKGRWRDDFFCNQNPIVVELGCGKGDYTVGLAKRQPNVNYIGMDVKGARMWTGATMVKNEGLTNVAFIRGEIEMITNFFAPGEIDELWITFPDPQMKKTSKRLTSTRFLYKYIEVMKTNGIIHLKTDSPFLYTYTKELIKLNNFNIYSIIEDLYNEKEAPDIATDIQTYYEQQWLSRGLTIKYIEFSPSLTNNTPLLEPDIEIEYDSYRSFGRNRQMNIENKDIYGK